MIDPALALPIATAVAAVLVAVLGVWRARRAAAALAAWQHVAGGRGRRRVWVRPVLLTVAAAAAVVAVVGHGAGRERRAPAGQVVPVVFALDVSRSMEVDDAAPSRRTAGELLVQRLVRRPTALNAGFLVFAGEAVLVCPLTTDSTAQRLALAEASTLRDTLIGGSALGPAIAGAVDALPAARRSAVVLVSDGDDTAGDLDPVLTRAVARGVVVHAIGVGTPDGRMMAVRRGDRVGGEQRLARLDEDRLRGIALATGGTYLRWDGSDASVRAVERLLADDQSSAPASRLPLTGVRLLVGLAFLLLTIEPWLSRTARGTRG